MRAGKERQIMRVKKIITLFTVAALTLGSLTGCGSSAGTDGKE